MAYRGDTCEEKNLLFSVRKSHVFQLRSQFDVFLGRNTDQRIRDFHVIKNSKQEYLVFRGDSVIAEVIIHEDHIPHPDMWPLPFSHMQYEVGIRLRPHHARSCMKT